MLPPTSPIRKKQKSNDFEEIHQDAKLLAEVCHAMKENNHLKETNTTQSLVSNHCNYNNESTLPLTALPSQNEEGINNITPNRNKIKQSSIVTPSSPQKPRKINYDNIQHNNHDQNNEYNNMHHYETSHAYNTYARREKHDMNELNMSSSSDTNHTLLSTTLNHHKQILYEDSSILPKVLQYEHHDCHSRYEGNDTYNHYYDHDYNHHLYSHHDPPYSHAYSNDCCYCNYIPYNRDYHYHPPSSDPMINHDMNYSNSYYSSPSTPPINTHTLYKEHKNNEHVTLYKKFSWKHYPKVSNLFTP